MEEIILFIIENCLLKIREDEITKYDFISPHV